MAEETKEAPTKIDITEGVSELISNNESTGVYDFVPLDYPFPLCIDREKKELLSKWGMDTQLVFKKFRFNERFREENLDAFFVDFFNDSNVKENLQVFAQLFVPFLK